MKLQKSDDALKGLTAEENALRKEL